VVAPLADERERRIEVVGPDATIAFTNKGARLISWRLEAFKDAKGRDEEMVANVPGGPRPLDVETGDPSVDARLLEGLFKASAETLPLTSAGGTLTFRYAQGDLEAEKLLRFEPKGYLASLSVQVRQAGKNLPVRLLWGPGLGNPTPQEKEVQGYVPPQAVALARGGVERIPAEKLSTPQALPEVEWVGVESQYFAALLVPPQGIGGGQLRAVTIPGAEGRGGTFAAAAVELGTSPQPALLYVGPKDYQSLSRLGHRFAEVVPVGDWIGPIVVMLMRLLRFVQGHVGNYGWSIVALTVLINLLMSPLRHYSIANGIKMAKIAPEMKVIQERYRGLPAMEKHEKVQKEMAALYAKHGMSMGTQMAMGCMPLLLTMPFLFAFYRVLSVSIELRGASFLWISDLSHKDPLFITPVLMGASMVLMQRMTPSAMDPAQQRMMMIMPLVFMVMFFAAPAGLNLYWLASNVCSILQQAVTLKIVGAAAAPGKAPDRRKK
jgi:YidC/Oxa1 family membrane protein insertase